MFHIRAKRIRRRAIVLAVFGLAPAIPSLVLLHSAGSLGDALRSSEQVTYALVLAASAFAYFYWRTAKATGHEIATRTAGWLTVGLLFTSLQGLAQASLIRPVPAEWREAWPLVSELVLLTALIGAALVSERADTPGDPAVVGSVAALVLTAGGAVTVHAVPAPAIAPTPGHLLDATLAVVGIVFAWSVLRHRHTSSWARPRLGAAAGLLALGSCLTNLGTRNQLVVDVAVFANLAGAVVLITMSQALLRRSLLTHYREVLRLQETLAQVRADVLHERELLHEVGATVAGIANASEVMRTAPAFMTVESRDRLEQMLEAELARLCRMMQGRSPAAAYPDEDAPEAPDVALDVALDDVLRHLVTSHEARGLAVHWEPSGLRAAGDADELAEVVNVLLSNARRHGAREVWLEARPAAGCVELTCSDDGPGVAEELRARLFDSGVRGADSPGQGLGLAIARRHLTERGGSLELGDSTVHPGATFVARLPISEMADAHHAA